MSALIMTPLLCLSASLRPGPGVTPGFGCPRRRLTSTTLFPRIINRSGGQGARARRESVRLHGEQKKKRRDVSEHAVRAKSRQVPHRTRVVIDGGEEKQPHGRRIRISSLTPTQVCKPLPPALVCERRQCERHRAAWLGRRLSERRCPRPYSSAPLGPLESLSSCL